MPAITVENISKRYRKGQLGYRTLREDLYNLTGQLLHLRRGNRRCYDERYMWALKDVSFQVEKGERLGIIGANGSGKTTLLRLLAGITRPTEGSISLKGRMGVLIELTAGFHPELTGRENIYLNGAIMGLSRKEIQRKFDEIVDFAELEDWVDTPIKRYSSGMNVRLGFAVAAHLDPDILLVDEVLAVGDAAFQKKCLGKMGTAAEEGRTVVFVSHNMGSVRSLCSKAILLENGHIKFEGHIDEAITEYLAKGTSEMSTIVKLPPGPPEAPGIGRCLRLLSLNGSPQAHFHLGEPWRISLEFEIKKQLEHVIAAVGLVTLDGVPVITYWSKPKDLIIGQYCVDFECTVPLSSCDILIGVGLSENERVFYYAEGVGRVSIAELSQGEQPFRARGAGLLLSTQRPDIKPI
jgi:lipopolysaccharide transport system ATP-binding protein